MLLLGVGSSYAQNSSTSYLCIGGCYITDDNKGDLRDALNSYWRNYKTYGSVFGEMSYDSETNTLTLNNCELELNFYMSLLCNYTNKPLILNIKGTNTIKYTCTLRNNESFPVILSCDITSVRKLKYRVSICHRCQEYVLTKCRFGRHYLNNSVW